MLPSPPPQGVGWPLRGCRRFFFGQGKFVEASALPEADLKARELVEALGERFVFGTNDPLPMLFEEGFRHVRSVSFDEACLSLTGSYDRNRQFRFQRMVLASATAPR